MSKEAASMSAADVAVAPASLPSSAPVVVIPAYKPVRQLSDIVRRIVSAGSVQAVIVVDDGSGPEWQPVFRQVERLPRTVVLRHMANLGKGAALKTAFDHVLCAFHASVGVVTADADGQHLVPDILNIAGAISERPDNVILGCRRMAGDVPLRSRFGNLVTRCVMWPVTGQKLCDTQTGLRGIPLALLPILLRSKASGYDFELDMLVTCKYTNRAIMEIPIATVYLEGNRSSHFNPLIDSMRIYFVLLRFTFIALITAGLDNLVFFLAFAAAPSVLTCQVVSRLCAGTYNFHANKRTVFQSHVRSLTALPRYCGSVVVFGALSYILIQSLLAYTPLTIGPAKLLAESIMFPFSFVIQRDFIFSESEASEE